MAYCCPKCGSRDIVRTERGYNAKKGLFGYIAFGLVGTLAGLHGNKRLMWVWGQCNAIFKEPTIAADFTSIPIDNPVIAPRSAEELIAEACQQPKEPTKSMPPVVKQRMVCECGAYNSIYAKFCFSCSAPLSMASNITVPALPNKGVICTCGLKNTLNSKYCAGCGTFLKYSELELVNNKPTFQQSPCPHCG